MIKVYLAGPEVFLPDAAAVFEQKINVCLRLGVTPLTPLDNDVAIASYTPRGAASKIYTANIQMIADADAVVANITPFRGIHMDPGTAFEIGYAIALDKWVGCYTQDATQITERIARDWGAPRKIDHHLVDKEGYIIENFGMSENLMIKAAVAEQGGVVAKASLPHMDQFLSIAGFEEALRDVIDRIKTTRR